MPKGKTKLKRLSYLSGSEEEERRGKNQDDLEGTSNDSKRLGEAEMISRPVVMPREYTSGSWDEHVRHFNQLSFCLLMSWVLGCSARLVHYQQSYPRGGSNNGLQYDFSYAINDVNSGVVTDRWEEKRNGVVRGGYSLVEPGGSIRTVDYQADGKSGFKAVVKTTSPGVYFLSTQEYQKSQEIHPQPSPELEIPRVYIPSGDKPVNYHAINAEILGFQKLFGIKISPRMFFPPSPVRTSPRKRGLGFSYIYAI